MSICLSLRQSLKSCQSKSFLWREIWSLEILTSHKRLLMMWLCLMTFTQGHLVSSRSLEGKEHNFVLSISFFYWETFEVPTLYKDFLWPEDVNDFNPRPFVQVQGHWKENMHIFCLLYTFLMKKHWKILLYIKRAYDLSWGKFKIIFKNLHDSSLGKLVMEKDWKWNFGHLCKFKAIPIEKCWSYFIFLAGGIIWELVHSTSYQPYLSLVLVNVH